VKKKALVPSLQLSRETIYQLDSKASVGCDFNSTVPKTLSRLVSCVQ
jgi:hypothetical protein